MKLPSRISVECAHSEKQIRSLPGPVGGKTAAACLAAIALLLLAVSGAHAQAVFGSQAVGATSGAQNVTVTAQVAGTVQSVNILTLGASGLDFQAGLGSSTCGGATLAAGGTCTESVTFTPSAPGLRVGAVVLVGTSGNVLGTAYLSGTGSGGLAVLTPGNFPPVAGNGGWTSVDDGKPATQAELNLPAGVAVDGAGNIYIADSLHDRIRLVTASTGIISTIAGNGDPTYTGDNGPAAASTLNTPNGVTVDGAGNVYIADTGNNVVRTINAATGIITTVAGTGVQGHSGDSGAATSAELNEPWGVTVDAGGNLFIADTGNHRVRRVDAVTGIITTVAGNGFMSANGGGGYSGDNGPATSAELNRPMAVAFDAQGNMYIPDSLNNRVRVVSSGTITTFAGTGIAGYMGDGALASQAELYTPSGVAVDPAGNVYISDAQNDAIRKVRAANGYITTLAVRGTGQYLLNGMLEGVTLYGPIGICLDGNGDLFVADYYDMAVREIQSNFAVVDFSGVPVRQGDQSAPKNLTVEDDGNASLDLTTITPGTNTAVNNPTTTCADGNPVNVGADCIVSAIFAPTVAGDPLTGNIDVTGATVNSPLVIELIGDATPVNSTTTTVTSSLNPSGFGQNVTFTATVNTGATSGNLTGTVSFFDGTTTLAANVPLKAPGTTATATFTTSTLAVGLHSITAVYNVANDPAHFSSTSPMLTQTVLEATAVGLVSSANPSAVGQNVTFTATVTISGGGGVAPDGTVTFNDGGNFLATIALGSNGVATYSTATLTQGPHAITASYSGDTTNQIQPSLSAVLNQAVQSPSSTVVISALNPSNYGVPVTFTATVAPGAGVAATGAVNFFDGAQQIGTGTLVGTTNQTTFTTSALIVGTHTITATYQGDSSNGQSTSPAIMQMVNQTQTSTGLQATPSVGIAGVPVAITATVKVVTGSATTTGTVTFNDGGASLGSATLTAGGTATINPILAAGQHSIVATYSGDSNDAGSVSAALALTVQLATTQATVTSGSNPSIVDTSITFTAKVTGNGPTPTGTVTFLSNGTSIGTATLTAGTATFTYAGFAAGTYPITVSYAGDANDSPSTSAAISQVVGTIPTSVDLGASATSGPSPQTILVAVVINTAGAGPTPTGTVTFEVGTTVLGSATLDSSGVATLSPNLAAGTSYNITAIYSGDASHTSSTSQVVPVSGTATGFSVGVTPATVSVAMTQNATVTVSLTSNDGFSDTIGMGCASLPPGITCHFSNNSVAVAANAVSTTQLTIDTDNPLSGGTPTSMNSAPHSGLGNKSISLAGLLLPFSLFFGWTLWRFRRRHAKVLTMVLVLALSVAAMLATGCGGLGTSAAKPGTYVIQVTGNGVNSNISHYQNVTLTITQ